MLTRCPSDPMFYVPLYVEMLRSRPVLVFWLATLAQAVVWLAVPMLFYSAPPGDLAQLLAIGHEFRFDAGVGPPLAYWLAEIAFRLAGLFGVYALAQVCVVTTYWCVFALGRAIVGADACGHGGAADGRHFAVHGAVAGFRPADPDHGAVGGGAAALLAGRRCGGERRSWYVLWRRGGAYAARIGRGADPARRAGIVHRGRRSAAAPRSMPSKPGSWRLRSSSFCSCI